MPQVTLPTRKQPNDATSSSFGMPSKIDINNLNLNDIGADSPELALRRARYQAVRTNTTAQQAQLQNKQSPTRITTSAPTNQVNEPIAQVDDMLETATDENTSQEIVTDPNQVKQDKTIKDSQSKSEDRDRGKEDNNKESDTKSKDSTKDDLKNNKPESQGGGVEKKDPGVKPETLPASEQSKNSQKTSGQENDDSKSARLGQAKIEALKNLKNTQDKLKSGDLSGAVEGVTAASKVASSWMLTTMWGAVWLDWTLLTLLGLNVYFVVSNFTDKIASFGEDYLFGKWMPKELAKWFEIILLALLDMIILSIIFMILYGGYKFYTASFWDTFFGYVTGGTEGAIKANLD